MEQITVATKLKVDNSVTFFLQFIPFGLFIATMVIFDDWQNTRLFPIIICSFSIVMLTILPKHNIKALTLNDQGATIHRHLLKDLYFPYEKLAYVWQYNFCFRGFELDTNLFDEQAEIIAAFNVFRTRGLIKAPERKPVLREIVEQWAAPIVILFSILVVSAIDIFGLVTESVRVNNTTLLCAIIVSVAAFLAQTIYRFLLRRRKTS